MGYEREIYDRATERLSERRTRAKRLAHAHRDEVAKCCPRALEIEQEIAKAGLQTARIIVAGGVDVKKKIDELARRNLAQQAEFAEVMAQAGFSADYMEPQYECAACRDEGYIDGAMCECMKLLLKEEANARLNRLTPLELSDFAHFDLSYYPNEPDEKTKMIPRNKMEGIFRFCHAYAENFGPDSPSVLMMGATGLGKTHLSLAIARAAIERGFGVIYGSAQNFMLQLERERFGRAAANSESERLLLDCDLLILDDLGAEFITPFVTSTVYNLINTRLMAGKPTIISTNLSIQELEDKYSQRIVSRIIGNYRVLPFAGHDVRQIKRRQEMSK